MNLIIINKKINFFEKLKIRALIEKKNFNYEIIFLEDNSDYEIKFKENIINIAKYNFIQNIKDNTKDEIHKFTSNLADNYIQYFNQKFWAYNQLSEINILSDSEWKIFYKLQLLKEIFISKYQNIYVFSKFDERKIINEYCSKNKSFLVKNYNYNIFDRLYNNTLYFIIKYSLKYLISFFFLLSIIIILRVYKKSNKFTSSNYYLSYFPFCWKKSNDYCDQYYSSIIHKKILESDNNSYLLFLHDPNSVSILEFIKNLILLKKQNKIFNEQIIIENEIKFNLLLKIYFNLDFIKKFLNCLAFNKGSIIFSYDGLSFYDVFKKNYLYNTLFYYYKNLLLEKIFRRIVKKKFKNKNININLYLFEHVQSRSITKGLRSSENIKINGYQHSIILEDKLIYQQRKSNKLPDNYYPNKILLDGTHAVNILNKNNFLNYNYLENIGSLRHQEVIESNKYKKIKKFNKNNILFSCGWHDSDIIFNLLLNLHKYINYNIIFSVHPKLHKKKIFKYLKIIKNNNIKVNFVKGIKIDYFEKSIYTITTYSTTGIESVLYNTPTLILYNSNNWNINLFDIKKNNLFSFDQSELKKYILNNINNKELNKKILYEQSLFVKKLFSNF